MYDEAELTKLNDGNLDSVTESHLSKPRRKYVHRAVRIFIICFHHLPSYEDPFQTALRFLRFLPPSKTAGGPC